jgi:hypothetical protein
MTPRIALIIGIAATALAFGVPTGLAERQLVGLAEPDGVAYVYANERATLAQQSDSPARQGDSPTTAAFLARQRATLAQQSDSRARHSDSSATAAFYANERATLQATAPDWFERFVAVAAQESARASGPGFATTLASTSSESGSDIAWGQMGLAFAIGSLLALGLGMAMRLTNRIDVVEHDR